MSASCVPARRARARRRHAPPGNQSSTRHEFTYVKLPICVQLFFGDAATQNFPFHAEVGPLSRFSISRSEEGSGHAKLRLAKLHRETPRRGRGKTSQSAMLASATTPPGFPLVWEGVPTANYTMVGYDAGMLNIQVNA
jgi:hypothetical protein